MTDPLRDLRRRFFDDWIAAEPEEATTLGLTDPEGRLRDPSVAAADAAAARARSVLAELDVIEGSLDADARLDAWAIRAHATEVALASDRGLAESRPMAVPYAIMMLAHAAARASSPDGAALVARRLEGLVGYVASARDALDSGARSGRPFSTAVLAVVSDQLDGAAADLHEIVETAFSRSAEGSASAKLRAHEAADRAGADIAGLASFLRERVATSPGARDVVPIGQAEYERRLHAWWRLGSLAELRRRANAELLTARDAMIDAGRALAPTLAGAPTRIETFDDARLVLDIVLKPRPSSPEEIIPMYEREIARAVAFCRERHQFTIPEACHCAVLRSPELWRRIAPCTNWPAPLLGGDAFGACAVLVDPALHPLANVPGLAVHEGVPGHFLQSRAWQIRFGKAESPVRFLSVPDECGVLRDAWIPHFMIEGWAVFAEARMEAAGFYDGTARLFHFYCRSIHAARALADIGLHTEEWSRQRVIEFLSGATGMPASSCASQAVRYAQVPMQALGYLIGHLEIERVRARASERLGSAYDERAFQAELLDAGPVPPSLLL